MNHHPSTEFSKAILLLAEAQELQKKAQYQKAIDKLLKANPIFEAQKKWEHLLESHLSLCKCYFTSNHYSKSIAFGKQGLSIIQTHFEENPLWTAKFQVVISKACIYSHQFEEGKELVLLALGFFQKQEERNKLQIAGCYQIMAFYYGQIGDFKRQKQYYEQALTLYIEEGKVNSIEVASVYESLAFCSKNLGLLNKMLEYLNKSLRIYKENFGENHPETAHMYFKISFYYSMKGDVDEALNYTHKSLNLLLKHGEKQLFKISNCYNALGFLVGRKEDYEKQLHFFFEERNIFKKLQKNRELRGQLLTNSSNIAYSYTKMGNYDSALVYLQEALDFAKKVFGKKSYTIVELQVNMGVVLLKKGELKDAHAYLQKSLQMGLKFYGKKHMIIGNAYQHLGDYYEHVQNFPKQIEAYQKAIIALVTHFDEEDYHINPSSIQLDQAHTIMLLALLHKKANCLVKEYLSTHQLQDLKTAVHTYQTTINFVQLMRQHHQAEGSKFLLSKTTIRIFDDAFHAIYLLLKKVKTNQEKKALKNQFFQFSEYSRAALLLSSVKENEAKANAAIPSELLQKEQEIKRKLTYLQKSIAQQKAKGVEATHPLLLEFQSEYFDSQQAYQQLIQVFEKNYSAYYQLKYNVESATVEQIQTYLQQQEKHPTALLSYFVGEQYLSISIITSTDFEIHQVSKPPHFNELIEDLQEALQLIDIEEFIETSRQLYQLLISPIEASIKEAKKLIVLRHDVLEYLPFEVLLTADIPSKVSAKYANLPYLLQQCEICYHYSATLFLNGISKSKITQNTPDTFLGFAPVNFNDEEVIELALESKQGENKILRSNRAGEQALQQLPNTEIEVKEVYQLFQAKRLDARAFLYGSASKQNLLSEAPKYKFILISTHGFVENETTGLSGIYLAEIVEKQKHTSPPKHNHQHKYLNTEKNSSLYTSDTYHLQLNADLVVLSSCSSGIGKLQKGEGMMAMNRGFLYAGASNIVFTQFDIPDQSSSLLVQKMFQHILEGDSYPTALQKAKLELIQTKGNSPQDWAGFALIGG